MASPRQAPWPVRWSDARAVRVPSGLGGPGPHVEKHFRLRWGLGLGVRPAQVTVCIPR